MKTPFNKPFFDVKEYGAKGDGVTDDTTAVQNAVNAAVGGVCQLSPGTYLVDTINVPSNVAINGPGTLKYKANTTSFAILSVAAQSNVEIVGVNFDGNVANQTTWSEQRHAIKVLTGDHVQIRDCRFINLIGDGVYIGPNEAGAPYTGSYDVQVLGCDFLGSSQNRNGISVICAQKILIANNYFEAMGTSAEPGAIDLEPDNANEFIKDVLIADNVIVGGTAANTNLQQAIAVQNSIANATFSNIAIVGNRIRGELRYGIAVFGGTPGVDVLIQGNDIGDMAGLTTSVGIIVSSAIANIVANMVRNMGYVCIESSGSNTLNIVGNFCHSPVNYGIYQNGTADKGRISNNYIVDAGLGGTDPARCGIYLTGSNLEITGNRIQSTSTSNTQQGIYQTSGTFCLIAGNSFVGMGGHSFNFTTGPHVWGKNYDDGSAPFDDIIVGTLPPTTGSWKAGTRIENPTPSAGGPIAWECIASGSPGTWKATGYFHKLNTLTGAATLSDGEETVFVNGASVYTATLPATHTAGTRKTFKTDANCGANNKTIAGNGHTIDGAASVVMSSNYESITVESDGTNWWIV